MTCKIAVKNSAFLETDKACIFRAIIGDVTAPLAGLGKYALCHVALVSNLVSLQSSLRAFALHSSLPASGSAISVSCIEKVERLPKLFQRVDHRYRVGAAILRALSSVNTPQDKR